jgi:hypothetical protein
MTPRSGVLHMVRTSCGRSSLTVAASFEGDIGCLRQRRRLLLLWLSHGTRSPRKKWSEGAVRWTIVRLGIAIFFSMNLMAFTMTMWSLDVYDVQRDPFQTQLFEVFRWLSMIFSSARAAAAGNSTAAERHHQLATTHLFDRPADRHRRRGRLCDLRGERASRIRIGLLRGRCDGPGHGHAGPLV